jgi:hypothetical protein
MQVLTWSKSHQICAMTAAYFSRLCQSPVVNPMAHGDARQGKWRGNWRMEYVASTLHTTSEHGVSALLPLMRTLRLPVVDWTDVPADLNGLVRFAERRNLLSARVPSHFKRSLHHPTLPSYAIMLVAVFSSHKYAWLPSWCYFWSEWCLLKV